MPEVTGARPGPAEAPRSPFRPPGQEPVNEEGARVSTEVETAPVIEDAFEILPIFRDGPTGRFGDLIGPGAATIPLELTSIEHS